MPSQRIVRVRDDSKATVNIPTLVYSIGKFKYTSY